jgi:hypothetical protein
MIFPNISALKKLVNNFFPGAPNTTQDFLQLSRASDGTILGWIDETGTPRGTLASVPTALPTIPFFSNNPTPGFTPNQGALIAGSGGGTEGFVEFANSIGGFAFYLPAQITTSGIAVYVSTADSTNEYDIGIYGPLTEPMPYVSFPPTFVSVTLPLVCSTGPTQYTSGSQAAAASWTTPATIPAGYYLMLFTTAGASGLDLRLGGASQSGSVDCLPFIAVELETNSTGSTLPDTVSGFLVTTQQASEQSLSVYFDLF